ncbi:MAG: glycosyltransferase family 1 protein [Flavobacteriia bacterium]|nr:MAG: glycosyltransferase family 1 protein [Flavobacteriia bacterium]
MRIGMILDKTFPPDPRVENEALALIDAGFEVFLFCLKYHDEPEKEVIEKIQVRRYSSGTLEYKLSALAYTFPLYTGKMYKKILDFLNVNKIDAIHIHDIRIAEAVFKANKKLQLPVVLDLHDNMPEVMKDYPHLQKFPGKQLISPQKWKEKEEEFIEKSDKVITVSNEFIEEVIDRTGIDRDKIVLVPNTVRRSFYENAVIDEDITERFWKNFTILYLGDTALRRGLLTAIEAVNILKTRIKHLKLIIVGESTTDDVLKAKVKELELEEFVVFEGWQDVSLFPSYITASDICISPLYRSAQHDVAYANKVFQYMSFAKPVVVSDALAQKKLVEETKSGLVHKEKDAKDLAEKIMLLYKDPELRKELGENGKRFIGEEFVWEKVSDSLVEIYYNFETNNSHKV